MALPTVPGTAAANTIDTLINQTRGYIEVGPASWNSGVTVPVANGGTGATTVATARNALGLGNTSGAVPVANGGTGSTSASAARTALGVTASNVPSTGSNVQADIDYLAGLIAGKLSKSGDTMIGPLYLNNFSAVTSGYVAVYRNGPDGRLGPAPSAKKYKKLIKDYDGSALDLRPVTYVLKGDKENTVRVGIVADEANEVEPMLVVHEDGEIESFKYELLAVALLRDVQRQHETIEALTARVEALEAKL